MIGPRRKKLYSNISQPVPINNLPNIKVNKRYRLLKIPLYVSLFHISFISMSYFYNFLLCSEKLTFTFLIDRRNACLPIVIKYVCY